MHGGSSVADVADVLSDELSVMQKKWLYMRALRGDNSLCDDEPPQQYLNGFSALDGDTVNAIAEALPLGRRFMNSSSRDRRSPSLTALASTCQNMRTLLKAKMSRTHAEFIEREKRLDELCTWRLQTSLCTMRLASLSASRAGVAACGICGMVFERAGDLYWRGDGGEAADADDDDAAAAETTAEEETDAVSSALARGRLCCAHCWRDELELSMRPDSMGPEVTQTWEDPIEEGTWQMVEECAFLLHALSIPHTSRQ